MSKTFQHRAPSARKEFAVIRVYQRVQMLERNQNFPQRYNIFSEHTCGSLVSCVIKESIYGLTSVCFLPELQIFTRTSNQSGVKTFHIVVHIIPLYVFVSDVRWRLVGSCHLRRPE